MYAEIWLSEVGEGIDSIMEGVVRIEKNDIYSFTKRAIESAAVMYEHHEEFDRLLRVSLNMNPKRHSDQRPPTDIDEDVKAARLIIRRCKPFSNLSTTDLHTLTNKLIDTNALAKSSSAAPVVAEKKHDGVKIGFKELAQEGLDELISYAKGEYTGKFMKKVLLKPAKERKARKSAKSAAADADSEDADVDEL